MKLPPKLPTKFGTKFRHEFRGRVYDCFWPLHYEGVSSNTRYCSVGFPGHLSACRYFRSHWYVYRPQCSFGHGNHLLPLHVPVHHRVYIANWSPDGFSPFSGEYGQEQWTSGDEGRRSQFIQDTRTTSNLGGFAEPNGGICGWLGHTGNQCEASLNKKRRDRTETHSWKRPQTKSHLPRRVRCYLPYCSSISFPRGRRGDESDFWGWRDDEMAHRRRERIICWR